MQEFFLCLKRSVESGALKKLILSKAEKDAPQKVTGRLCTVKGETHLALEETLGNGKVNHQNIPVSGLTEEISESFTSRYRQIDLITALGNAEYRRSKSGKETLLGGTALLRALSSQNTVFSFDYRFDRKKNYILDGSEPFLFALGISDKSGRIHDKKQAKFRQINRFLEHVSDVVPHLPKEGPLLIYDLCCGKSYLSFAVYHYFTAVCGRQVEMLCVDLKRDVIAFCQELTRAMGFDGMHFITDDIRNTPKDRRPHLVISLHACDVATDIVLETAASLSADVILSTPCCHHELETKLSTPCLSFVTAHPFLRHKISETLTDALRLLRLRSEGYKVSAAELTDPDDTPKNTLLRAVRIRDFRKNSKEAVAAQREYDAALRFLVGDAAKNH